MATSVGVMPPVWLNYLSRQQSEQLAAELGVSTEGTLELREREQVGFSGGS
jgi:hypothetical protein